jgi:hypothetical protein
MAQVRWGWGGVETRWIMLRKRCEQKSMAIGKHVLVNLSWAVGITENEAFSLLNFVGEA